MSVLPDELWTKVIELGVRSCGFTYKDLCCISITCRRLHRLSDEDSFWSYLLSSDFLLAQKPSVNPFPSSYYSSSSSESPSSSFKSRYKFLFEERRRVAHRRAVLRKQRQIVTHSRKLRDIKARVAQETDKMREAALEWSNLYKRSEVVRGRQKQIAEQSVVPAEPRIHALEMEFRLCKEQIMGLEKSFEDEKRRLDTAEEELASLKYNLVRERHSASGEENKYSFRRRS